MRAPRRAASNRRRASSRLNSSLDPAMVDEPPLPPEPKHFVNAYEQIGRGISIWATMEMRLVQIAARLLGATEQKTGLILYSINNFYTWITIIDGLFDQTSEFRDQHSRWSGLVSRLKELNDIRVRLAHQAVYLDVHETVEGDIIVIPAGLKPTPFDIRPKQMKLKPLTEKEVIEFCESVTTLFDKLAEIVKAIDAAKASP